MALIHFPIALFLAGVLFDVLCFARRQTQLGQVALYNFCAAAISTIPAIATGLIAWQWALEGRRMKGTLRLQLICAVAATVLIWVVCVFAWRERRSGASRAETLAKYLLEFLAAGLLGLAGHLGGFLSGVNGVKASRDQKLSGSIESLGSERQGEKQIPHPARSAGLHE